MGMEKGQIGELSLSVQPSVVRAREEMAGIMISF